MTIQLGALADTVFTGENAAYSRGFRAAFRVDNGPWKICTVSHGAGGTHPIWCESAEAAKEAAREWVRKMIAKRKRGSK